MGKQYGLTPAQWYLYEPRWSRLLMVARERCAERIEYWRERDRPKG